MHNYDFLILSPHEFENLSRDLLQKKLAVFLESFTLGKDGGIDLRCSLDKKKTLVVQSKRVKDFPTLMSNLKKEAENLKRIAPERYIVSTSVGLTPGNKATIRSLFEPYIKDDEDILGQILGACRSRNRVVGGTTGSNQ